ncbi:MAG: GNAT family N-acetyltransferase [Gammaproteobacteria bacterium]|nr:GNAT family N-acetyltransferase [Gammaproteobacteria bacterium]
MKLIPLLRTGDPQHAIANPPAELGYVRSAYAGLYQRVGYAPPWLGYVATVDGHCVGTCGFKSPPVDNRVEIAYFTFPGFEGRGFATGMARALIDISVNEAPAVCIAAQTLPEESASTSILRRLGFVCVDTVFHPDDGPVWEWRLECAQQDFASAASVG